MKLSSKLSSSQQTFCIRATAKGITEIDHLPLRFLSCSQLFLSHNSIKSLRNIEQFRFLSRLMMEYNNICYIEDLIYLKNLPNLIELRLEGNPVCRLPLWDIYVIDICKKLQLLNGKEVRRLDKTNIIQMEKSLLNNMFFIDIAINIAKRNNTKKDKAQIADVIQECMKSIKKKDYINKMRLSSPSKEMDQYFTFLKKEASKKLHSFNRIFPKCPQQINLTFQNNLPKLTSLAEHPNTYSNNINFRKTLSLLTGLSLQSIGLQSDEEVTDILSYDNNKIIKESLSLAQLNEEDSNMSQRISDYHPTLSIQSKSKEIHSNNYCPTLFTVEDSHFEIPETQENEDEDEEELLKKFEMSDDSSSSSSTEQKYSEKGLTFDHQMKREIMESEALLSHNENENGNDTSSSDSFKQQQLILNVNPITTTIPISDVSGSDLISYSPKFLENPVQSSHNRARRMSVEEFRLKNRSNIMAKIATTPSAFLMMKFFELWKRRFQKRVNRRVRRKALSQSSDNMSQASDSLKKSGNKFAEFRELMGDTIGEMLSSESPAFEGSALIRSRSQRSGIPKLPIRSKPFF
ncbi:hypothetical protein TRFO_20005 [Tritrichomonas foetus]|uniref:Leucine Rich Repeat family protein n=1 Tax=Tritrichomonas foetus TaxID=1144522 RepID=A0A1J4KLD2_9EUKA|nr:hypothetical protein TRFO_20005 [Tritrichomonas foetus]|eukprot:OHT10604.1 hypothetical protein TRFO_20005 [Tritrichomonas foetus]